MKDDKYLRILDAVVRLEVLKGHLRWKMSDLSRLSGVQRTLIYYYFGKSKESILAAALKTIGDDFFGLEPRRLEMWKEGRMKDSILLTRERFRQAPHVAEFFFHWRHQKDSPVARELRHLESRYLHKVREHLRIDEREAQALFAVFFGLALVPDLQTEVIDHVLQSLKRSS